MTTTAKVLNATCANCDANLVRITQVKQDYVTCPICRRVCTVEEVAGSSKVTLARPVTTTGKIADMAYKAWRGRSDLANSLYDLSDS